MSDIHDPRFFEDLLIKFMYIKEEVRNRILPFLTVQIFEREENVKIIKHINSFMEEYESFPKIKDTKLTFNGQPSVQEQINSFMAIDESDFDDEFLLNELEDFIKEKMISNVCMDTFHGLSEGDLDSIVDSPDRLRDAFAFSFNTTIGLDLFGSEERLFNFLHKREHILSSGLKDYDDAVGGGFHEKSLTLFLAECVSEDTIVRVRIKNKHKDWEGIPVEIKYVKELIKEGWLDVDSPDGWVHVTGYVDKGEKKLFEVEVDGNFNKKVVKCSENHLFETNEGWVLLKDLDVNIHKVLRDDLSYHSFTVKELDEFGKVVDLVIDHPNHRYYTNGISSHNTNLGKSLIMSSLAVANVFLNKKVLYVTCELAEDNTAERMMANVFDIPIDQLKMISKNKFHDRYAKFEQLKEKFIIREFPAKSVNVNHIRNLVKDLQMKLKYTPEIIYLDQIGNLNSAYRVKSDNTYTEMSKVTMETRGLATELGIPIVSCIQTNRCLALNTKVDVIRCSVEMKINLGAIQEMDLIYSDEGYKAVNKVFEIQEQMCFKIGLESGKEIVCSIRHMFPSNRGMSTLEDGLDVGDMLISENGYDKITSVVYVGRRKTIDISVDGNNLFYANGILTHNSGFSSSEIDLTNTGDSIGYVQTADVVVGVTQSEEMRNAGKFAWTLLKNRYGINKKKLTVCVNYEKMRVTDDVNNVTSLRNEGDRTPETYKEKQTRKSNAVSDIASLIKGNKEIKDKGFIDFD